MTEETYQQFIQQGEYRYGPKLDAPPPPIGKKFVPGFGIAERLACPVCGGACEQFTRGENPTQYACVTCFAVVTHLGALWFCQR